MLGKFTDKFNIQQGPLNMTPLRLGETDNINTMRKLTEQILWLADSNNEFNQ